MSVLAGYQLLRNSAIILFLVCLLINTARFEFASGVIFLTGHFLIMF